MKELIKQRIDTLVDSFNGWTKYRKPFVSFVPASSPRFGLLQQVAHSKHLLPEDLLPGARSVVAFFLPFAPEIIEANRLSSDVAREWCMAYIETNAFISEICDDLQSVLESQGIKSAYAKATHNFDEVDLVSFWSHKHVAWAAGLGSFGVNHLLITPVGCAGRFGSLVLDQNIVDSEPELTTRGCLVKGGKQCGKCIAACPSSALTEQGLDKARCYQQLLRVDASFPDLATCDVCGKCVLGPCALQSF